MYISLITICILFGLCNYLFYEKSKTQLISIVLFTLSALLTFTKSFLFIAAGWVVLLLFRYYKKPLLIFFVFLSFILSHIALTHFLIIPNQHLDNPKLTQSPYSSNEVVYSSKDYSIIGSGYSTFKKTAWLLFKQNPIMGIGPGNYTNHVAHLKSEGLYPINLPNYDPHSTYFGALAETGLIGFITLLLLGLSILYLFSEMNVLKNPFSFSLLFIFCIIIAEGISMDTMNFRHYWVVVSIIVFQFCKTNEVIAV